MKTKAMQTLVVGALLSSLLTACGSESKTNSKALGVGQNKMVQSGPISISGKMVEKTEDKLTLDKRILIVEGSVLPQLSETVDPAVSGEALPSEGYIILGCEEDQVDKELVKGLKPIQVPEPQENKFHIKAQTIIFCDSVRFPYTELAFTAKNLILLNSDFSTLENSGSVTWTAENLVLMGENTISTGRPALILNVINSVQGEGHLKLSSAL